MESNLVVKTELDKLNSDDVVDWIVALPTLSSLKTMVIMGTSIPFQAERP